MKVVLEERAISALADAVPHIQRTFWKQLRFLVRNLHHPSLNAKKYDEGRNLWQGRVNDDWRFFFTIKDDSYVISDVVPHPK